MSLQGLHPVRRGGMWCFCLLLTILNAGGARAATTHFTFRLPESSLHLTGEPLPEGGEVTHVSLAGLEPELRVGQPGLPSLPFTRRQVALPRGARVSGLEVKPGASQAHRGIVLVGWVQQDQPSADREPLPPNDPVDGETGTPIFYPPAAASGPDPAIARTEVWPAREPVEIVDVRERGEFQIATVEIRPVQWFPGTGQLRFTSTFDITIVHEGGSELQIRRSYRQAMDLEEARGLVVNAEDVPDSYGSFPGLPQELDAWYLIVTDNFKWNASEIQRGSPVPGDMVAEMQRLAQWKREKGLQAQVVTVSDIVAGRYGNFTEGSRDLQEILRRFLKHARAEFGTYWVLLGGDTSVIPVRSVVMQCAADASYFTLASKMKPDEGKCAWDQATGTVRIHTPGNVSPGTRIIAVGNGEVFEQVANPSSVEPGWAFASNDTYQTLSAVQTSFIVLRGNSGVIQNRSFHAAVDSNTIPTDLYYASLVGAEYGIPGRHDWDKNQNGIYGQYEGGLPVDGVDLEPDLALGRAPVESGAEAKTFVDKLLVYERHEGLDPSFSHKLLLGSSNWSRGSAASSGGENPPEKKLYFSAPGSSSAHLHFDGAPSDNAELRLVAYNGPGDWWIVPYNRVANAVTLGWHFCTDATYSTVSEFPYSINGATLRIPVRTEYVRVLGPPDQVHPTKYFFDPVAMDRSALEKEELKEELEGDFPELDLRKRLYSDFLDVPDFPAPDLFELTQSLMTSELNSGYNLVSLSGHGNPSGCCSVSSSSVKDLTNGARAGIVYANSCLTARFDNNDCVGEDFLLRVGGGAVAYIGNTRFGWVKAGGAFENSFWKSMVIDRHLGRMLNSKAQLTAREIDIWTNFTLNLLGDPELEVWTDSPPDLTVDLPVEVAPGLPFDVKVPGAGPARVCLMGPDGKIEIHFITDGGGTTFSTRSFAPGDSLLVTVTRSGAVPFQARLRVRPEVGLPRFIRGDVNLDRRIDISDPLSLLGALFLGEAAVRCDDAADVNDDGAVDISDARKILDFLFLGGSLPPGTTPGLPQEDPTPDPLGCAEPQ